MTVNATDVSGIPAGDATGTSLSGTYLITSASIEACLCRVGSCAMITAQTGGTLSFSQQGGGLSIIDQSGTVLTGGVNADLSYTCGGTATVPAGEGQGQVYGLQKGTFAVSGSTPTETQFQIYETLTATFLGASYDCDYVGAGIAHYEGP